MKVLAVVTCYNPTPELLLRSVSSYAGDVDKLLVWRNSSLPEELESELAGRFHAEFRGDGTNAGISTALNAAWKEASAGNYDFLLTMDQDSVWHHFDAYLSKALSNGPSMCFYSPLTLLAGEMPSPGSNSLFAPVEIAITSGMLIPVSVINRVGGWDERFKIDAVDDEFCLHARSLGIRCWECGAGWLEHRLGDRRLVSLLWMHFYTYNYSPQRLYGIYRNHIIAFRRYKGAVSRKARHYFVRIWVHRRPIRILLGEKGRKAKFLAIFRGIRDGFLDGKD